MPTILETTRLRLREFTRADAALLIELLNDPGFLRNVGDRGVHSIEEAEKYFAEKLERSYREHEFGLYVMELRKSGEAIGMCGLVQRDYLDVPDLGFSILERFTRRGYTFEAASAVLQWARATLRIPEVVAVTRATNSAAHALLNKLGLVIVRPIEVPASDAQWLLFASPA